MSEASVTQEAPDVGEDSTDLLVLVGAPALERGLCVETLASSQRWRCTASQIRDQACPSAYCDLCRTVFSSAFQSLPCAGVAGGLWGIAVIVLIAIFARAFRKGRATGSPPRSTARIAASRNPKQQSECESLRGCCSAALLVEVAVVKHSPLVALQACG